MGPRMTTPITVVRYGQTSLDQRYSGWFGAELGLLNIGDNMTSPAMQLPLHELAAKANQTAYHNWGQRDPKYKRLYKKMGPGGHESWL